MEYDSTSGSGSDSAPHTYMRSQKHVGRSAPFERRIRVFCLLIAAPAFVLAAILLWQAKVSETMASTLLGGAALLFIDRSGHAHGGDHPSAADAGQRGLRAARVGLLFSCPRQPAARCAGRACP